MTSTLEPPARPTPDQPTVDEAIHRRRWAILAVLCLAVFVTVLGAAVDLFGHGAQAAAAGGEDLSRPFLPGASGSSGGPTSVGGPSAP